MGQFPQSVIDEERKLRHATGPAAQTPRCQADE